jgi:hypothetical protein
MRAVLAALWFFLSGPLLAASFASKTKERMKVVITGMSLESERNRYRAVGTVTLTDDQGKPITDAAVLGEWSFKDVFLNDSNIATDKLGRAVVYSDWVDATTDDVFSLTIVSVRKGNDDFSPAGRPEASTEITSAPRPWNRRAG